MHSNLISSNRKKTKFQPHYLYYICFICIFIIFSITILIKFFSTTTKHLDPIGIFDVYKSAYLLSNETLLLNIHNHLTHHIYIDVGCFNGETIEHFIHFTPNSSFYDIITFEPDPINYQLCKQRLTQKKYSNYNIIIIPKVVWIRDEKVSYQTDCGQKCRIDSNKTSLTELDAIDFSSWLSHLIKTNNTKLHIKLSMPGAEVLLLRKMLVDGTFELADQWAVEWSDKSNLRTQPARVYVQLMFDTLGYDFRYFTSLPDVRRMFNINGSFDSITNHNWTSMTQPEVYYHYIQRPDLANIPPKNRTKLQKF
jgi:FkbM family methyltransferase